VALRASMIARESVRTVVSSYEPVKNPIRLGVVGLGHRAVHNVLGNTAVFDDYSPTAVCDIRPELVETVVNDFEQKHQLKLAGYTDFDEMIRKEKLDAVAILIDPDKQAPLAIKAMNAGLHVMIEVPATYSLQECWDLVVTHERTGKLCFLMEQLRYSGYIRAWRNIIEQGVIGKPLFAEGEYFNNKPDAFFQDDRGRFYTCDEAKHNPQAKPTWRHTCPTIGYLPHELSPLLFALNDRVVQVVGMGTRKQSYNYDNLKRADLQVALMHTERDTILRMAVSHSTTAIHRSGLGSHWHHIKGTRGVLEWARSDNEHSKLWVCDWQLPGPIDIPWTVQRLDAPPEVAASGHGGVDFYPFAHFADAVLRNDPLEFDIYRVVETAAPAILAAQSIDNGSVPMDVPDFHPNQSRRAGDYPQD